MPFRRRSTRFRRRRFGGLRGASRFRRFGRRRNRFGMPRSLTVYRPRLATPTVQKEATSVVDASIDIAGVVASIMPNLPNGFKCTLRYLNFRCMLGSTGSASDNVNIRVILFVDKHSVLTQTVPTVAGADDGVLEAATMTSSLNSMTAGRYAVLYDHVHCFNIGANVASATGTGNPLIQHKFFKVFRRLNFVVSSTTGGDDFGPSLYCLYLSDQDEVGTIDASARVGFISYGGQNT